MRHFCLIFLSFFFDGGSTYKILIFAPGHSNSQILFNYRFGDMVAARGHNVTIFVAHYNQMAGVEKPKLANVILFPAIKNQSIFHKVDTEFQDLVYKPDFNFIAYIRSFFDYIHQLFVNGCENILKDGEMMRRLELEKYDLAVSHMYDLCPIGMIHAAKIPTFIWMAAGTLLDTMAWSLGVPNPPSFVPAAFSTYSDRMSFVERFRNFYNIVFYRLVYQYWLVKPQTEIFRKFYGRGFPNLEHLSSEAPLVFVNSDEMLEFARPILHKTVYVGGASSKLAAPLKAKWAALAERSSGGFFAVSFGGVANSSMMPQSWRDTFLNAFAHYPQFNFIWKFETSIDAGGLSNVITTRWMPMRDLMAHPNFIGLITHGGYNSLLEASNFGVPMIVIPLFSDQVGNMLKARRWGTCVGLKRSDMFDGGKALSDAIGEITGNNSYRINARNLAHRLAKRPIKSEKLAVDWIEYLAEFKTMPSFQPTSVDLNLIEYFCLDVLFSTLSIAGFFVYFLYWIIYVSIRRCLVLRRISQDIEPSNDDDKKCK